MKKPLNQDCGRSSFSGIRTVCIAFLIIINFSGNLLLAQKLVKPAKNVGLRISTSISANRFGAIYTPSLFCKSKRHLFSAGIMVQKKNTNACGFQGVYELTILDRNSGNCYCSWLELYAFANAGYYNRVYLNATVCEEERVENPGFKECLDCKKLKAMEAYTGFGLKISFLKNFKWYGCIGIGGYDVLNAPRGLYYSTHAVGMLMRTGISFRFNRSSKTYF